MEQHIQSFQQRIKAELVDAMRAKDSVRVGVLRGLISGFTNELVATGHTPQDPISDESALKVTERAVKQRKDSIAQFEAGGRGDLAETEKIELAILEKYLPEKMSREEIATIAASKKAEYEAASGAPLDKTSAGKFTGMLMKELKGKANGDDVKAVVDAMIG